MGSAFTNSNSNKYSYGAFLVVSTSLYVIVQIQNPGEQSCKKQIFCQYLKSGN